MVRQLFVMGRQASDWRFDSLRRAPPPPQRRAPHPMSDGKNRKELRKDWDVGLKQGGANDAPAEGDKCLHSNDAGPMLRNTKYSELIQEIQRADLPF